MWTFQDWQRQMDSLPTTPPEWAPLVERWYQLDAPSYLLCQTYWESKNRLGSPPELILLNSPQSSFATDKGFCQSLSPSKFVHTLPNVRSSAFLQVIEWRGPLFSFVDEKAKILKYAEHVLNKTPVGRIWVLHVLEQPVLKVDWCVYEKRRDENNTH